MYNNWGATEWAVAVHIDTNDGVTTDYYSDFWTSTETVGDLANGLDAGTIKTADYSDSAIGAQIKIVAYSKSQGELG